MWGKVWLGVGTLLRQGGAGGCEKVVLRPPKEISSLRHCRVATEEDEVKLGGGGCLFDSFSAPEERMNDRSKGVSFSPYITCRKDTRGYLSAYS